jgi:hypothetical protein
MPPIGEDEPDWLSVLCPMAVGRVPLRKTADSGGQARGSAAAIAYRVSKQDRPGWHMSREQRISSGPRTVTVRAHQHELSGENSKWSISSGSAL